MCMTELIEETGGLPGLIFGMEGYLDIQFCFNSKDVQMNQHSMLTNIYSSYLIT